MRLGFLIATLIVAGCGSTAGGSGSTSDVTADTATGTDATSGISADQACSDSANAQCQKLDACHVSGVSIRYGSTDVCVSRVKANCLSALGAANTGRTPDNDEACALAQPSASCSDFSQGTIAACQAPAGTRAVGNPCTFNAQCQSAFCAVAPGVACGTCAAVPTPGQSCTNTQCGPGQVCLKATSVCAPFGASGAACSFTAECEVGMTCVGAVASTSTTGKCMTGAEVLAAACDRTSGPQCDEIQGLYCSFTPKATAGSCVKFLTATSGACGFTAGTATTGSSYTICLGGGECVIPTGQSAGSCVPDAPDGQPCDTVNGPFCLTPARCITSPGLTSGTCELPDPTKC